MIGHYLPKAVANGDYMKARDKMAYAQYLAGIAFNNASLGYVHAMAHQLGGFYDLPHGVCNALLLPYVERFNIIGNYDRTCSSCCRAFSAVLCRKPGVCSRAMCSRAACASFCSCCSCGQCRI